MPLSGRLEEALGRRGPLLERLSREQTDCYRLFHGVNEGRPGLSIDAYGPLTLVQVSSREPLLTDEVKAAKEFVSGRPGPWVVSSRRGPRLELIEESISGAWSAVYWCREFGNEFAINLEKAHRDPQLFLDFRAAKRRIRQLVQARPTVSTLNLFSYTCTVSCHCASLGEGPVISVDFSAGNLQWGEKNFRRNRLKRRNLQFVAQDCLHLLWSLTGREAAITRKGSKPLEIEPKRFDLVVVDPPAFARGKFGNVDLVHDPETVFTPAWSVVSPGGWLVAANNSARVSRDEFEAKLTQMIEKAGVPYQGLEYLSPDSDFPSRDGEHPLKVFIVQRE